MNAFTKVNVANQIKLKDPHGGGKCLEREVQAFVNHPYHL
jgi:hypothetical protein